MKENIGTWIGQSPTTSTYHGVKPQTQCQTLKLQPACQFLVAVEPFAWASGQFNNAVLTSVCKEVRLHTVI